VFTTKQSGPLIELQDSLMDLYVQRTAAKHVGDWAELRALEMAIDDAVIRMARFRRCLPIGTHRIKA